MIMCQECIKAAEQRARRYSGAYTGTCGAMAADIIRLIYFVRQLQRDSDGKNGDHRHCDLCHRRDQEQ